MTQPSNYRQAFSELELGGEANAAWINLGELETAARELLVERSRVARLGKLPDNLVQNVVDELSLEESWEEVLHLQSQLGGLCEVSEADFTAAAPCQRFSQKGRLRKAAFHDSTSIKEVCRTLKSPELVEAVSNVIGQPLSIAGLNILRYRHGDYIRRHSDTAAGRNFGVLAFFTAEAWQPGFGGEFLIEDRAGRTSVVVPSSGEVIIFRLDPDMQHQVAPIRQRNWRRYSIACHLAVSATHGD